MKKFKNIKKILTSVTLASVFLVGACGKSKSETNKQDSTEVETQHFVKNTLHDVTVTENASRTFVKNGKTDYKIIMGNASSSMNKAVNFIIKNVNDATGVTLLSENSSEEIVANWSKNDKVIVFDCKDIFAKAELTVPTSIGNSGYYIKTVGNTVFITCNSSDAYQVGAIKFLDAVLGYDMLAEDCVIYEKSGETMPDMDIIEKPDFAYRAAPTFTWSDSTVYGMGYQYANLDSVYMPVPYRGASWTLTVHNCFNYLPPEIYNNPDDPDNYHPNWFWKAGIVNEQQLCYTAGGDETEYNLMVDTLYEHLYQTVLAYPDMSNITVTHYDNQSACNCEACLEAKQQYGAISATIIKFLNDVDDKLQADLQALADEKGEPKREVNILFFAYHATKDSPTVLGEDGEYHAISEEVIMNENVGVLIAPIESYYTSTFYDDINIEKGETENIKSWSALTDTVFIWAYQSMFRSYMYPYMTWDTQMENTRFFIENNAVYLFNHGQHNQKNASVFMTLKYYVDSKAQINVNVNYKDLQEKFFKYYFREAAEPMQEMFYQIQANLMWIEENHPSDLSGKIGNDNATCLIAKQTYWSYQLLQSYLGYIDEAYAAIEQYKGNAPETYEMLKNHINIESMFPRYALLTLYSEQMEQTQRDQMRLEFISDCNALGMKQQGEYATMDELFKEWQK